MSNSSFGDVATFNIQLAQQLKDVDLAIIVQFFINTISMHKRLGRNQHDGHTWNYCTRKELCAYFPYWNEDQIRRKLENLVSLGILKTSNYNKKAFDKTLWYAFVDEEKWGISKIVYDWQKCQIEMAKMPNRDGKNARPIPPINNTDLPLSKERVNDGAKPSLTPKKQKEKSLFKPKVKFSDEQLDIFNWLKSLNINTSLDTLSWWARTYSLERLENVYREAMNRKAKSPGAYMQKLLKEKCVIVTGNVKENAEFAKDFKESNDWGSLEIHQKYAIIHHGNKKIEVNFNQDSKEFAEDLIEKYKVYK